MNTGPNLRSEYILKDSEEVNRYWSSRYGRDLTPIEVMEIKDALVQLSWWLRMAQEEVLDDKG